MECGTVLSRVFNYVRNPAAYCQPISLRLSHTFLFISDWSGNQSFSAFISYEQGMPEGQGISQ